MAIKVYDFQQPIKLILMAEVLKDIFEYQIQGKNELRNIKLLDRRFLLPTYLS
jgi:hypothetical protein